MDILDAIRERRSIRAYLDRDVSDETVRSILDTARWSPSGVNIQPWRVAVVKGTAKQAIGDAIIAARNAGTRENPDYHYYPQEWFGPYKQRRKACGLALYGALGIGRDDTEKRVEAWYNNYRFFGAPVGLLFFMEKNLGQGAWLDMGMFIQSVMLAARAHGLESCPQASLAEYPDIVRQALKIEDNWLVLGGLSLGYADTAAAVNQYRTERQGVDEFTQWHT